MLRWIKNEAIDKQKWDACIETCEWGKVYALSWYLDLLTENNWEALVLGDYEYIMPVPYRKKFGIKYTYRPNFCQQLGVFSFENILNQSVSINFIQEFTTRYKHIHYPLNHSNILTLAKDFTLKKRTNLILSLKDDYESIYQKYSLNLKQNLKKTEKHNLKIREDIDSNQVIEIYKNAWQSFHPIPIREYLNFQKIMEYAKMKGISSTYGVYLNDKLVAACFLIKFKDRLYYPFSGISLEGKKVSAISFLINRIIRKYSNTSLYLDFEGSDIESVKYFYNKFRPINESYFLIIKSFYFIESFFFFRNIFKKALFFKNKYLLL